MIDKLHLRSDRDISAKITKEFTEAFCSRVSRVSDKLYNDAIVMFRGKHHFLTVKREPRVSSLPSSVIYLNPSRFSSLEELTYYLECITPTDALQLSRIDHMADVPYSIHHISSIVQVRNKRHRHDYGDRDAFTGMEFGGDEEIICIYDKAFELLKKKKYRLLPGETPGICTRIEIRHKRRKLAYKNFKDLPQYLEEMPFKPLQFKNVKEEGEETLTKAILKLHVEKLGGLHAAYKRLNQNNNFNVTYGKHLEASSLEAEVLENYRNGLRQFIYGSNEAAKVAGEF